MLIRLAFRVVLAYALSSEVRLHAAMPSNQLGDACSLSYSLIKSDLEQRPWPALCVALDLGLSGLVAIEEPLTKAQWIPEDRSYTAYARPYFSLFLTRGMSAHIRYYHREEWNEDSRLNFSSSYWESAFLQFGHTLLDDINASVGLVDLPFGLNYEVLSENFRNDENLDRFWLERLKAVRLSWFRHDRTLIEFGVASVEQAGSPRLDIDSSSSPWSLRISKDLPALEGTKLLFSYARAQGEFQSIGFASLNRTLDGSTSFEWVRRIPLDNSGEDFIQLFRLNYSGPWQNFRSWYFEYQDQRFTSWHFMIGRQHLLTRYLKFSLEAGYQGIRIEGKKSQWIISGNLDFSI